MGMDMLSGPVFQGKGVWIRNFECIGADPQAMRHYDGCGLSCLGIYQVTWKNKAFIRTAELSFFRGHIMLPGCSTLLLCSVFLCAFPSFLLIPFHHFTCGN